MMGMIRSKDREIGTAWKVAIFSAVLFVIATTYRDEMQSRKLKDLEHRIEILTLRLEQQQKGH